MKRFITLSILISLHHFAFLQVFKNSGSSHTNNTNSGVNLGVRVSGSTNTGSGKTQIIKPTGNTSFTNTNNNFTNTQNNNPRPQFTGNTTNNNYYFQGGAGSSYNPNNFSNPNNVWLNPYGGSNYSYHSSTNTYEQSQSFENYDDLSFGSSIYSVDADGSRILLESSSNPNAVSSAQKIRERIKTNTIHFTGLVMSDNFWESHTSKAFIDDEYSEFLTPGKYGRIGDYLPNAVKFTFDGIAIPFGTRMIIYSEPNFSGNILVDVTGPAIINNVKWENDPRYTSANTKNYVPELQGQFPQAVRQWSVSNMHEWQNGSIEILKVQ